MTFADLIDRAQIAQQFEDPASPQAVMYAEMLNVLESIQQVAVLEPCHDHRDGFPQHIFQENGCTDMREAVALKVFDAIGFDWNELPHQLHENCYTCRPEKMGQGRLPAQEKPRQTLRELHQWAGTTPPLMLMEPGCDVVQIGDVGRVLSALTNEFESWQVVTKRLADMYPEIPHGYMATERYWAVVSALEDRGLVQRRDISTRLTPSGVSVPEGGSK